MTTKELLLDYLHREMRDGHAESIAQIAGATGLSRSTTFANLKDLMKLGIVTQGNILESDKDEEKVIGRGWWISSVLIRHDGIFLFLRRDEGNRIIMREVLLDRTRIIEGGVDEEGNSSQTGSQEIGGEATMRKGTADGDMEARQCSPVATEGTACCRDAGTRAGKGER